MIEAVVARLSTSAAVVVGPGDDAAVVLAPDGRVVATTDVLVEGVHFRLDWSSAYDVGRKAAAASLADVAAMGGTATSLLVGLGAPPDVPVAWATDLADGLRDEADVVGAVVVGGDTVSSDRVVVSVTALGDLGGRSPVLRSGAQPGDRVVLAGRLGWSAAGLALLQQAVSLPSAPAAPEGGASLIPALVQAHLRPTPPYALGPELADLGATAMCDVSDGLVADLGHLARASGVRIDVESRRFAREPLLGRAARAVGQHPLDFVLTGGEDHALVATLPAGVPLPDGVTRIGLVRPGAGVRVIGWKPSSTSWDHFRVGPGGPAPDRRRRPSP
jgi:thiamine-monophosphate kinase